MHKRESNMSSRISWMKGHRLTYNSNLVCKGYHRRTICYYPNSTTTFNLSILSCGDVEANPGPKKSDEARDIQKLANKLKYDMNQLIDIGKSSKVTISSQIKNTINELGLQRCLAIKRPTHRGCRGGRRKIKHFKNFIPTIIGITKTNAKNASKRSADSTNLVQVPITSIHQTKSPPLPQIMLFNARSLGNKFDETVAIMQDNNIDLCAITETWFKPDMPYQIISIPGYSTFAKPRSDRIGGGVAIYARHEFKPTSIESISVPEDLEIVKKTLNYDLLDYHGLYLVLFVQSSTTHNQITLLLKDW